MNQFLGQSYNGMTYTNNLYGTQNAGMFSSSNLNMYMSPTNSVSFQSINFGSANFNPQSFNALNYNNIFPAFNNTNNSSLTTSSNSATQSDDSRYMSKTDPDRLNKLYSTWEDIAKTRGLGQDFFAKVIEISDRIGCHPEDLIAVMNGESGLNSKAVNSNGGATGLIQFMPSTAEGYGLTTEQIADMTPVEQLDLVEKFYINSKNMSGLRDKSMITGADLASIAFLPARADREVLTTSNEEYYKQNSTLDYDKDGDIDKIDEAYHISKKIRFAPQNLA